MKPTCIIFDTSRETSITMHSDNGVSETHMVFMTHIFRNVQKVLNLLGFLNLSNTKDLTFGFISKEGEIQKFPLDKELNTSLLGFLQQTNSEESQKQDCMQFLKWLIGQGQISDNEN